ncbi:putative manganese-dependent inorganic diphosphatase [Dehalobacterium formicoaceticum]|uniref:inorganic diphosphatase n=1 Tax=Dehalobacterium formicoaceticum TaxID=51515 RepID=A0ABT1Y035_9FIRM|nr:putative manganese-dependent inorganic diphosphatase [Dehalobacterium formicoaceticum]MCR6544215.1 putative manganese-dependent inorganic diphosphatase [Dehalobacterium formicoaceticum]
MPKTIYVLGHKNPDTDSICSAIAYAELKRKQGLAAVPGRLGELNQETEFVLNYFEVEAPQLVKTVKKQVSDLNMDVVPSLSPEIPIKTTWNVMKKSNLKSLPVVDDNERLLGVVTLSDITEKYMDAVDNNLIAASKTPLGNIADTLNAKIIWGEEKDYNTTGKVLILAADPSQLEFFVEEGDIVIAGNRRDSIVKAMELGANCVILTCQNEDDPSLIEAAQKAGCILMTTQTDTFTAARLINLSIPISYVMTTRELVKFSIDDFVDEVKETMMTTRYRSYPVVDKNNKVLGFISRYHVISQNRKQVILVDHNEMGQTVTGIEEAEILEIIDHHRLGDIQTGKPIFFKNEPVGCTSTIIANMYFDGGIKPSKKMAGLMCSAILSDTLRFQSPTCTYLDRVTAEKLGEIANIDIESYALQMFKAGSGLKGKSPREILLDDFKELTFNKGRIGIGQVYTIDRESIEEMKADLLSFMASFCQDGNYGLILLLITDIINQGSEILFVGKLKDVIGKAFDVQTMEHSVYLPGVVSRKKQVIPNISTVLE